MELDKDIHGLAHISQLSEKPVSNVENVAKAGDEIDFYIVSMDPKNHRLGLSLIKPALKKKKENVSDSDRPAGLVAVAGEKSKDQEIKKEIKPVSKDKAVKKTKKDKKTEEAKAETKTGT